MLHYYSAKDEIHSSLAALKVNHSQFTCRNYYYYLQWSTVTAEQQAVLNFHSFYVLKNKQTGFPCFFDPLKVFVATTMRA